VREHLRWMVGPQDASDVCQDFFGKKVMREGVPRKADPSRGSLVTSINYLVRQQWRTGCAKKRGGGMHHEESVDGAQSLGAVPLHKASPDRLHDLAWALDLLEQAISDSETWRWQSDRTRLFEVLRPMLVWSGPHRGHKDTAAELGMTPRYVATRLHRLRLRVTRCAEERVEQKYGGLSVMSAEESSEFRRILEDPY